VSALQAVVIFLALMVVLVLVKRFSRAIITGLAVIGGLAVLAILAVAYVVLSNPEILDLLEVLR
jgi:amino acid permease